MMWVDTHCHLNDEQLADDLPGVLMRAGDAGVGMMLVVGIDARRSEQALALARINPTLRAIVGAHPNHAHELTPSDKVRIETMAADPLAVGVGETGLDYHWKTVAPEIQAPVFDWQLQLAWDLGKPFVIHCREADGDVLDRLRRHRQRVGRPLRGVMHSFVGDQAMAEECVALGLHLSFAGMVTFKKNDAPRAVARWAPLERILVETDAPYLTPHPHRGKRNEPAYVALTGAVVAAARGMAVEDFAAATSRNAAELFGFPVDMNQSGGVG